MYGLSIAVLNLVFPAPCEGVEEMIQQSEYQCDDEAVPQCPHRRIGFAPKPERAGGVDHEESDEPHQRPHEKTGSSTHKIAYLVRLQTIAIRNEAYGRNLAQ